MPILVIVAGPNGSGKTTLVRSGALADLMAVPAASINADDIARQLANGAQPTNAQSLLAAQTADAMLDGEIAAGRSVIVETVLSSEKFKSRVAAARAAGFEFVLIYVSVRIAGLNVARVANRFVLGGHDVPTERIVARRIRSHEMFVWFAKEADKAFIFDNSTALPSIAAFKDGPRWELRDLEYVALDLAESIRGLAGRELAE